jgi:hypothetical protein
VYTFVLVYGCLLWNSLHNLWQPLCRMRVQYLQSRLAKGMRGWLSNAIGTECTDVLARLHFGGFKCDGKF